MALTFSVVDTWDDGQRIHVSGTIAPTGNYTTSGVVEDSQKVTVSCEPTHQFYAGRRAAAILTHNYTFSS